MLLNVDDFLAALISFIASVKHLLQMLDDPQVMYKAALHYLKKKNEEKAFELLQFAASNGHVDAQVKLGNYYLKRKQFHEAKECFAQAANQGSPTAQYNLGVLYGAGFEIIPVNATMAAYWFHKAAQQGHANAQYWLGIYYQLGSGVRKDQNKAAEWLRKAREQGHPKAREALLNLGTK